MSDGEAWARLVKLGAADDIVNISTDSFTVGRSAECDLVFTDNKLVSQKHCTITREDDTVYLTDSSTNGTQVDGTKVKQARQELNHGDEIHIVFKKSGTDSNIGYAFQQLSKIIPDSLEQTQEYDSIDFTANTHIDPDEPPRKQKKLDTGAGPADDVRPDAAAKAAAAAQDEPDEIEETLLCSICQELLHDCVSLQPCMHTYCGGCFSQWMATSKSCPTCRKRATSVAQNHILRNLIDAYLKAHPDKRRSAEDLEELDKKNKIKVPNMSLKDEGRDDSDRDDYSGGSDRDYDSDDDDDDDGDVFRGIFCAPIHIPRNLNADVPVCRQCPGYDDYRLRHGIHPRPASSVPSDGGTGASSGTSAAASASGSAAPTAPDFQCTTGTQRHIVCYCCMEPFPDRHGTPDMPPKECDVCNSVYCHLYWGCRSASCRGCLTKLKDMNPAESALDMILLYNPTESNILKNYMRAKSITINQMVQSACTKLDRGDFQLNNEFGGGFSGQNIGGDSNVCYRCSLKALRQLAYNYRKHIDPTDLPAAVTNKEDCYWGKTCRTQSRPHHAEKWNHICEQTRFTR